MKLEAVDKRSPGLIRVSTVEEVDTHRIKVILCVCVCMKNEVLNVCGYELYECLCVCKCVCGWMLHFP